MVVIDTSVWVQALRAAASREREEVDRLLAQEEAAIVGPVLAEVLQGARTQAELEGLYVRLTALPFLVATQHTWSRVGELSFQLRRDGASMSLVDILIATLAMEHDCALYTLDEHFHRIPGVRLHGAEAA
jgi:hypothetical protein